MNALSSAQELWDDPAQCIEMIQMWDDNAAKKNAEEMIACRAGNCGSLVDLGCGPGRFASVMQYDSYCGYDSSHTMISLAREVLGHKKDVEFAIADIFEFQSGAVYDTLLMNDVAQHQEDPIESILRVLSIWTAHRYLISLLVGEERQELSFSNVASLDDVLKLLALKQSPQNVFEPIPEENFGWMLLVFDGGIPNDR